MTNKRNHQANNYHIRLRIWDRDKHKCRWCYAPVEFREMIIGHGTAFSEAPTLDDYGNWFTSCFDCNSKLGVRSFPPRPIPPDEVQIVSLSDLAVQQILEAQAKPKSEPEPVGFLERCLLKTLSPGDSSCLMLGRCTRRKCEHYVDRRPGVPRVLPLSDYDPFSKERMSEEETAR